MLMMIVSHNADFISTIVVLKYCSIFTVWQFLKNANNPTELF